MLNDEFGRRWGTPEGVLIAGEVLDRLKAGAPLGGLGLGEVDGRVDLRGFPAPLPRPVSRAEVVREQAGRFDPGALWRLSERVGLDGVALRGLDLSGAVLRNVTFKGMDLAAIRLPDDPGLRVIRNYPCVMRKAAAALAGREDNPAVFLRMRFNGALKGIDLGPPVGLLNRNDYLRWGGEEMAALLDSVIAGAERECAG